MSVTTRRTATYFCLAHRTRPAHGLDLHARHQPGLFQTRPPRAGTRPGPEYAQLAVLLAEIRPRVKASRALLKEPQRQRLFERIVYSDILYLFAEGDEAAARERVEAILAKGRNKGMRDNG